MNLEKESSVSIIVRVSVFATLIILATFMTLWASAAYDLARWGWTVRGSLGSATFLPFPTGPRGVLMDVIAKMSPADGFIYLHLLKTGVLTALCVSLWALVVIYVFTAFLPLLKNPKITHTKYDQKPRGARLRTACANRFRKPQNTKRSYYYCF